jgi:hypothetical protein
MADENVPRDESQAEPAAAEAPRDRGRRDDRDRDMFASFALMGIVGAIPYPDLPMANKTHWAAVAYGFADAMIAVRDGRDGERAEGSER